VINSALARIEVDLTGIIANLDATGSAPAPDIVRQRYSATSKRTTAMPFADLFSTYDFLIRNNGLRSATNKIQRKSRNHLNAFADQTGLRHAFKRLDRHFWDRFRCYGLR
jgi:hypothetical protein